MNNVKFRTGSPLINEINQREQPPVAVPSDEIYNYQIAQWVVRHAYFLPVEATNSYTIEKLTDEDIDKFRVNNEKK